MSVKTASSLKLVVGLGNPGPEYTDTRHNAGVWLIDALARAFACRLQSDKKAKGHIGQCTIAGRAVRLLVPDSYMNLSGESVAAVATFYKISAAEILVAHDELDIPTGAARLKQGGGHGGHNGLRDIVKRLGNNSDFMRLRIGIDHPRNIRPEKSGDVSNYVLRKPSSEQRQDIDDCLSECVRGVELIAEGDWQKAQTRINSYLAPRLAEAAEKKRLEQAAKKATAPKTNDDN